MINGLKENHYSLWYRLWEGWGWGFNLFLGFFIGMFLLGTMMLAIASDPIYQIANYLALSPSLSGMPFQLRLAIMGGGIFILAALVIAMVMIYRHYYVIPCKIQHEDLDLQLTAIEHKLESMGEKL